MRRTYILLMLHCISFLGFSQGEFSHTLNADSPQVVISTANTVGDNYEFKIKIVNSDKSEKEASFELSTLTLGQFETAIQNTLRNNDLDTSVIGKLKKQGKFQTAFFDLVLWRATANDNQGPTAAMVKWHGNSFKVFAAKTAIQKAVIKFNKFESTQKPKEGKDESKTRGENTTSKTSTNKTNNATDSNDNTKGDRSKAVQNNKLAETGNNKPGTEKQPDAPRESNTNDTGRNIVAVSSLLKSEFRKGYFVEVISNTPDTSLKTQSTIDSNHKTGRTIKPFSLKLKHSRRIKKALCAKKLLKIEVNNETDFTVYYKPSKRQAKFLEIGEAKVRDIQLEFNSSYLEKVVIEALVTKDGNTTAQSHLFYNNYPIPVASLRNIKLLDSVSLFNKDISQRMSPDAYRIKLSDVISYKPFLAPGRRDFSPGNYRYHLKNMAQESDSIYITKEPSRELFTARAYIDFLGLDKNNPNGLVQTEIARRVNLIATRFPLTKRNSALANFGWLQYATVTGTLSKLENNNREFAVRTYNSIVNKELRTYHYVTPISLISHETFSMGINANVFHLDLPEAKSYFDINFQYRIALTLLRDSVRQLEGYKIVNTNVTNTSTVVANQFMPNLRWVTQLEERYGIELNYYFNFLVMEYDRFRLVRSYDRYERTGSRTGVPIVGMFAVNVWFKPFAGIKRLNDKLPDTGEMFFRFQLHHNYAQHSEKFFQAQLGYSFHIFRNSK